MGRFQDVLKKPQDGVKTPTKTFPRLSQDPSRIFLDAPKTHRRLPLDAPTTPPGLHDAPDAHPRHPHLLTQPWVASSIWDRLLALLAPTNLYCHLLPQLWVEAPTMPEDASKAHPDAPKAPPDSFKSPPLASDALGGSQDIRAELQDLFFCFHGSPLASKLPEGIC